MNRRIQELGKIGNLTILNRIFMPAMGVNLGSPQGGVTDDLIAFYEARAAGGCGLIITEVTRIEDGVGISTPCQLAARNASDIPELQRLMDVIHKYNTRIFVQLQHPGASAFPQNGLRPVGASEVTMFSGGIKSRALTEGECVEYVQKFIVGARICQRAGADGIELHGAHGYLINNFLSPAMNHRTDCYGGSHENRMRFLKEIIFGIREACGSSFPISVRMNAEEDLKDGIDLTEAIEIAKDLEGFGVHAINVSCYSDRCIESSAYPQCSKRYLSNPIKKAVHIPVLSVSNVKEPSAAESLLEKNDCDFVGVGRGHLADSKWCEKAFSGQDAQIRTCTGCLVCFGEIVKSKRIRCTVNPETGREREYRGVNR